MKLFVIGVVAAVAWGCSAPNTIPAPSTTTSGPSASAVPGSRSPEASTSPSPFAGTPARVRLALDWTPNTDHTGIFVARHQGWYRDAGIDLQILPYATPPPETVLAAHQAPC